MAKPAEEKPPLVKPVTPVAKPVVPARSAGFNWKRWLPLGIIIVLLCVALPLGIGLYYLFGKGLGSQADLSSFAATLTRTPTHTLSPISTIPSTTPQASDSGSTAVIFTASTSKLSSLLRGPDMNHPNVGLPKAQTQGSFDVVIQCKHGDWFKVNTPGGSEGWLYKIWFDDPASINGSGIPECTNLPTPPAQTAVPPTDVPHVVPTNTPRPIATTAVPISTTPIPVATTAIPVISIPNAPASMSCYIDYDGLNYIAYCSWSDLSNNEDGFYYEESNNILGWFWSDTTSADVTYYASYVDCSSDPWTFSISAFNTEGYSASSSTQVTFTCP